MSKLMSKLHAKSMFPISTVNLLHGCVLYVTVELSSVIRQENIIFGQSQKFKGIFYSQSALYLCKIFRIMSF